MSITASVESSLDQLAAEIRREHESVKSAFRESVAHAITAGELLIEAKKQVAHGGWENWIEKNTDIKPRTAQAYMRLAREFPKLDEAKAQRVADLGLRATLDAIADPDRKKISVRQGETLTIGGRVTIKKAEPVELVKRPINVESVEFTKPNGETGTHRQIVGEAPPEKPERDPPVEREPNPDYNLIATVMPFYQTLTLLCGWSRKTTPQVLAQRLEHTDFDPVDLEQLAAWLSETAVELERLRA